MTNNIKRATTLDEQLKLLINRGVLIEDKDKAKECLLDIGYYRLGAYLFPFEETYPNVNNRNHKVVNGTKFSDAVSLYYFDFDLRIILIRYLTRIEISLRTYITYFLSNTYKDSVTWFADPSVMINMFINEFDLKYKEISKRPTIKRHHKKYINDKYAPAWKTLEYMSFGGIETLYQNLKNIKDKEEICNHFGVRNYKVFENYIYVIRTLRNTCAHGGVLYDLRLPFGIMTGPAGNFRSSDRHNLLGALKIVEFFLGQISANRLRDMQEQIAEALSKLYDKNPNLSNTIKKSSGDLKYKK